MPAFPSHARVGWAVIFAVALATAASGANIAASAIPPHPLVVATEKVCRRDLPKACDEMAKLASSSSGLTAGDSIGLLWVSVLRNLEGGDEAAARKGLSQILSLDRLAQPPTPAPARLGELLKEARALLPSKAPRQDKRSRLESDGQAAGEREPETQALLRAAQALYDILEMEGTAIVIDMARLSALPATAERAQVHVWLGVLKMELEAEDEPAARSMFREALDADRGVRPPNNLPPKTLRIFQEVKATTISQVQPSVEPATPAPPILAPATAPPKEKSRVSSGMRTWGLAVGGTGAALVVGGAVAGAMALSAHEAQKNASASGDWDAYLQHRDAAGTAAMAANGFYGAGAVALGAGAILFLSAPGEVKVEAGVAPGKLSLAVGGSF